MTVRPLTYSDMKKLLGKPGNDFYIEFFDANEIRQKATVRIWRIEYIPHSGCYCICDCGWLKLSRITRIVPCAETTR